MSKNYQDIALALSGVCQASKLVQQLAHQGLADQFALEVSLTSLLETQPENTLAVFGHDLANIQLGVHTLLEQLNSADPELGRYWLSLLALENRLNKNPAAKRELALRIEYLPAQLQHYALLDEPLMASLAGIYVDIISPLGSRIQVNGVLDFLQQESVQNKIRACLLAGIRSAVLWRQVGGSKWQLLFSRQKIIDAAKTLLLPL